MFWVDRIALFQQNGSRLEMFQGAVSQKNMCKERRVIQGLLLIAVFTAKQVRKFCTVGVISAFWPKLFEQ